MSKCPECKGKCKGHKTLSGEKEWCSDLYLPDGYARGYADGRKDAAKELLDHLSEITKGTGLE